MMHQVSADEKNRLLIVDDEPTNIQILSEILQEQYVLNAATSGVALLARLRGQPVLVHLPGGDGVPEAWLTMASFGEGNPARVGTNPHDALNRRVDITIQPVKVTEEAIKQLGS